MDPASIIGTTSAAITFVETVVKMASVARNVHHAMGELDEHKRLRDVTSALEPGITTLIGKRKSQTLLSPEEESLLRVAEQCQDISKQIPSFGFSNRANISSWPQITIVGKKESYSLIYPEDF